LLASNDFLSFHPIAPLLFSVAIERDLGFLKRF